MSGTKLDLSYLEGTIGYAIRRAQLGVFEDIYRAFGKLSITTAQFSALAVVADNPGCSQAALAAALGVERPRMVPLIDALERRGLARRASPAHDRRVRQIFLTSRGRRMLDVLKRRFARHQQRMLKRLGVSDPAPLLTALWNLAGRRSQRQGGS